MPHQGPYGKCPVGAPPSIKGFNSDLPRWSVVSNGDWYAFYNAVVGPDTSGKSGTWCIEHPNDPNWWSQSKDGQWVCRHGYVPSKCPDGSCGPEPSEVSATQVTTAVRGLRGILGDVGNEAADDGLALSENDLRLVMTLIDSLNSATKKLDGIFVHSATLIVKGKLDNQIGTLRLSTGNESNWYFTAHDPTHEQTS